MNTKADFGVERVRHARELGNSPPQQFLQKVITHLHEPGRLALEMLLSDLHFLGRFYQDLKSCRSKSARYISASYMRDRFLV